VPWTDQVPREGKVAEGAGEAVYERGKAEQAGGGHVATNESLWSCEEG